MLRLNWLAIDCRPYSTHINTYFFYAVILFQCFVVFLFVECVWKVEIIGEKKSQCINWMFPAFIMDPQCCFHVPFWSPLTNKVSVKRNALLNFFSFIFFFSQQFFFILQPTNERTNERKKTENFLPKISMECQIIKVAYMNSIQFGCSILMWYINDLLMSGKIRIPNLESSSVTCINSIQHDKHIIQRTIVTSVEIRLI